MARTPHAGPLGGFNLGGQLGDQDADQIGGNTRLFDAGPLGLPPFSSGLALPTNPNTHTFQPTDIPGLDLWLRADLGVTLSGSNVQTWADQSGNHRDCNQFTALNQPGQPVVNAGLNGQLALNFSSTNTYMAGASSLTVAPRELFVVANLTDPTSYRMFSSRMSTLDSQYSTGFAAAAAPLRIWDDGLNVTSNAVVFTAITVAPHIWHFVQPTAPGAVVLYMDGSTSNVVSSQPAGCTTENGAAGFFVGNLGGILGGLAEILSYNHFLTGLQTTSINAYLKARYGFP